MADAIKLKEVLNLPDRENVLEFTKNDSGKTILNLKIAIPTKTLGNAPDDLEKKCSEAQNHREIKLDTNYFSSTDESAVVELSKRNFDLTDGSCKLKIALNVVFKVPHYGSSPLDSELKKD